MKAGLLIAFQEHWPAFGGSLSMELVPPRCHVNTDKLLANANQHPFMQGDGLGLCQERDPIVALVYILMLTRHWQLTPVYCVQVDG